MEITIKEMETVNVGIQPAQLHLTQDIWLDTLTIFEDYHMYIFAEKKFSYYILKHL